MSDEIQHRETKAAPAEFGFEGDARVPIVDFDYGSLDDWNRQDKSITNDELNRAIRESNLQLLQFITGGLADPYEVGRRALILRHHIAQDETLDGLAKRLAGERGKMTTARASQLYKEFRNLIQKHQ